MATAQAAASSVNAGTAIHDSHRTRHPKRADFLIAVSFLGDATVVLLGLMVGFWLRFRSGWVTFGVPPTGHRELSDYFTLMAVGTAFFLAAFAHLDLYDQRNLLRFRRTALIIVKAAVFWFCAYLGTSLALKFDPPISRIYAAVSVISCVGLLMVWRFLFAQVVQTEAIARHLRQRVIIVGWTPEVWRLMEAIETDTSHPYEIVGSVQPQGEHPQPIPPSLKVLGNYEDIEKLIRSGHTDMLILAEPNLSSEQTLQLNELCEREYVQFKKVPSYFQILVSGLQLETISGVPILGVTQLPLDHLANRILKRMVDIVGALVGLIISAPIIAVFGSIVYLQSPGPIFYRQVRTGRNGQTFGIIKIRSMRPDAEAKGGAQWAKKEDPRRLPIGAFMRAWNIDEVPQFWNVLLGHMSLVGPRPERPELIERFKLEIPHYNARHGSKPGLTGWAQVHGLRGDTDLVARVQYDLYYLENWNVWMDFQIMALTFLSRKNAY